MRRPWELGHRERRGGPRVYVPITLPDTNSSTFAVLELVGFSNSSPSSSQSFISPSLSSISPLQKQEESLVCHSQQPLQPVSLSLNLPSLPLVASLHAPNSATNEDMLDLPHTENSVKSPQVYEVVASTKGVAPAPAMSPFVAKKTTAMPVASSLVGAQKTTAMDGKVHVVQTEIKENVVHTTSFNFKDVVQKLTGASCNDKAMIPVMLLNRPAATQTGNKTSANKVIDALSVRANASSGFKRGPSKIHERRKALHNLKRLCTDDKRLALSASSISPPTPSPVTPLASYFEKFCSAITPTASQSSRSSGLSSSRPSFPESDSSNMPIIAPTMAASIAEECAFDLLQTLGGPSLLSLFPESPICSPKEL